MRISWLLRAALVFAHGHSERRSKMFLNIINIMKSLYNSWATNPVQPTPGRCPQAYYSNWQNQCDPCPVGKSANSSRYQKIRIYRKQRSKQMVRQSLRTFMGHFDPTFGHLNATSAGRVGLESCGDCPVGQYAPMQGMLQCIGCSRGHTLDFDLSFSTFKLS